MKNKLIRTQAGIGLIELLLSISIIAVIVIGAIVLFSSANKSNKAQELTRGLTTISTAIHTIYGQQPNYSALTENAIALSGALPNGMTTGTGTAAEVVTTFGDVTIAVNGTNNRQVDITYASGTIPTDVCSKFVPSALNTVRSITIGGTAITTPDLAITNCATDVGSGNAGAIVFTID